MESGENGEKKPKIRRLRFHSRIAVRDADQEHKDTLKQINERNRKFWEDQKK